MKKERHLHIARNDRIIISRIYVELAGTVTGLPPMKKNRNFGVCAMCRKGPSTRIMGHQTTYRVAYTATVVWTSGRPMALHDARSSGAAGRRRRSFPRQSAMPVDRRTPFGLRVTRDVRVVAVRRRVCVVFRLAYSRSLRTAVFGVTDDERVGPLPPNASALLRCQ